MAFKFIAFAALVAAASAGFSQPKPVGYKIAHFSAHLSQSHPAPAAHAAPAVQSYYAAPSAESYYAAPAAESYYAAPAAESYHAKPEHEEPYDHHPKYSYAYDVHDSHTGDLKNHQESRDGDVVKGSYSLIEADGSRRVVHYSADDHHGFNAIVEKEAAKAPSAKQAGHGAYAEKVQHYAYVAPVVYQVVPVGQHSQSVSYGHADAHQDHYHH